MSVSIRSDASRAVVEIDGVDRAAFNGTGSLEMLTPQPPVGANEVPTFGTALTSATAVSTTAGTVIDFTGIPAWAKRVTVMLNGVSTSGTASVILQLGTASGVEVSGYLSNSAYVVTSTITVFNGTVGIFTDVNTSSTAASARHGALVLTRISGNTWTVLGTIGQSQAAISCTTSGTKALPGPLDRIRLTTTTGADTFDGGTMNIMWE